MKGKKVKILLCFFTVIVFLVACSSTPKNVNYGTNNRSIDCNLVKDKLILTNVRFYDEQYSKTYDDAKALTGEYTILSNSYNSNVITFQDEDCNTYVITASDKLSNLPKTLKIYIDSKGNTDSYKKVSVKY